MVDAISLEEARRRKKPPPSDDARPLIRIVKGEIYREVDEAEAALAAADDGLYCYGNRLVHIEWDFIRVAGGGVANALRLFEATGHNIRERMERAARFEKWDARVRDFVTCECPEDMAMTFLARGSWHLPPLLGVVTAPTLRPNGTVIDQPGYDVETGIVYHPHGIKFGLVPERPTKDQAFVALFGLQRLLRGFNFVTQADASVALSAILTAVVRRAMPVAPMHAFSSPVAGSGKSMLVNIASVIATGWQAAVTSSGNEGGSNAELEKRLTASLLMGDAVVSIDNIDRPLSGGFLCQFLTEHVLKLRVLGLSKNVATPNTAMFFSTGNNLVIADDATRRVLVSNINPNVERPELRSFAFKPVALALRARPYLVAKALVIIRAYIVSGERVRCPALGNFEEWSRFVRESLIWLGQADPAAVLEQVRARDPQLAKAQAVVEAWSEVIGTQEVPVRDVIKLANRLGPYEDGSFEHPELRDALRGVAEGRGKEDISPDKLGWWLRRHLHTVITVEGVGYFFISGRAKQHWQLMRS